MNFFEKYCYLPSHVLYYYAEQYNSKNSGRVMTIKLIISNMSGVPIYEQIKQQVKAAILSGDLQAEETLPSLRTLAKDLKISVLTVTKAYTELEQEGFVKNVQGKGCFVLGSGSELMKEQLICKVENSLTEAIKAAKIANLSNKELHHLLDVLLEANADD